MTVPKTFLMGCTEVNWGGLLDYLEYTNQEGFHIDWTYAAEDNIPRPLRLASLFAKLCYKSIAPGRNKNLTKTRSIKDNIESVIESRHGSVLEHVTFNFVTTGCSRVFTHELVRHRVGTAFSQTSGRYCALDEHSDIVVDDPVLPQHVRDAMRDHLHRTVELATKWRDEMGLDDKDFEYKKKVTSALRRMAPSGLANEIAWSTNLRALRHMIEMRTSRHAEWEIRHVFNEVATLIDPAYLTGGVFNAETQEWTGLKI